METHIFITPQCIYETTISHFPWACVNVQVHRTNEVSIKIILDSDLPEVRFNGSIYKQVYELRLERIKVLQILNRPLGPLVMDTTDFSVKQPLTEWLQFNRAVYESEGGRYVNLITDYLNNSTQEAEQKLLDLGLAPRQSFLTVFDEGMVDISYTEKGKNGASGTNVKILSLKYYKLSADQEYGPALITLADYYASEEVKDYKKACEYYQKAADQGYAEAQCNLGFHYERGNGVYKDISRAIHYFQLAADQGFITALYNLATYYERGEGITQSSEEAFKYYKKAADQGFAPGQFSVARRYSVGLGVKESLENAIEYYELALAQDYKKEEVLEKIQECRNVQKNRIKQTKVHPRLPRGTIFYPGAKRLDTSQYLKDRRPEVLRNIFKQVSDSAIYYIERDGLDEAEIPVIRDAMIENPRFVFICAETDLLHLYHSFKEIGYQPKSCLRCAKFKDKDLYRLLFMGEAA